MKLIENRLKLNKLTFLFSMAQSVGARLSVKIENENVGIFLFVTFFFKLMLQSISMKLSDHIRDKISLKKKKV